MRFVFLNRKFTYELRNSLILGLRSSLNILRSFVFGTDLQFY
jgi:hypothetical protein